MMPLGSKHTPETRARISATLRVNARRGEDHHQWKGDDAGYKSKHCWINRHHPRTGTCEECGEPAQTDWANIDHKYHRVREDWRELCRPCHNAYDIDHGLRSDERDAQGRLVAA